MPPIHLTPKFVVRAAGFMLGLGIGVIAGGCSSIGLRIALPGMAQGNPDGMLAPSPDYELLTLRTADGTKIGAQFGRALDADGKPLADYARRPTMIFFYGMKHVVASGGTQQLFGELRRMGVNAIIPDFPGYGMSEGRPSEQGCYAAGDAALDHLLGRDDIDHAQIISAGWSLGAAPAVDLASRRRVAGLLTVGAFTSAHDMGRLFYPNAPDWLVSSFFASSRFDNLVKISAVKCPILLVQGTRDSLVPPWMGDRLAGAATATVTRVPVKGATHDNVWRVGGEPLKQAITAWLAALSPAAAAKVD
jgi:pimeloyl-ACP methyl ester carboxylesterase